jgi:hypothetical protein
MELVNIIVSSCKIDYNGHSNKTGSQTGDLKMLVLFESKERRAKDRQEVVALFRKYGDETVDILRIRVTDKNLSSRDRKHWKRILSKAKSHRPQYDDESFVQRT